MEVWASVDPEYVNEKSDIAVLGNDRRWDLCCLVVRDPAVLFLDGLPF